jgi:hypothetical protein
MIGIQVKRREILRKDLAISSKEFTKVQNKLQGKQRF